MKPVLSHLGMTIDQHARKQVQMHSVARAVTQTLMRKLPAAFGKSFSHNKVYYSTMEGLSVSIEDFIDGNFDKYINNNGNISEPNSPDHKILIEKAECLRTKKQMMLFVMPFVIQKLPHRIYWRMENLIFVQEIWHLMQSIRF